MRKHTSDHTITKPVYTLQEFVVLLFEQQATDVYFACCAYTKVCRTAWQSLPMQFTFSPQRLGKYTTRTAAPFGQIRQVYLPSVTLDVCYKFYHKETGVKSCI